MAYYSLDIHVIKPDDIGHVAKRGWISNDGTIYAGEGDHDSILGRILKTVSEPTSNQRPLPRSGWIRWIGSVTGSLYIDWSEYGNDKSEGLARAVAKQISYPFERVWIDAPNWVSWKGPVDDFIKFGVKGRRAYVEARADIQIIQISDLGRNSHGWISPEGTIFTGSDEHSALSGYISERFGDDVGIGWIRYLTYPQGNKSILAFDWSAGLYTERSEGVARAIAKKASYPYDAVQCDYGNYKSWYGTLDEFVRHGVKGRRQTQFESRLESLLRAI